MAQQPGLQLFNCAHQDAAPLDRPHDGSTRLADGLKIAEVLRDEYPATFAFFCRVALPYTHVEGDVHMAHLAPIFALDPRTAEVVGFRYNETDRGTLDCLGFDETAAFYEHAAALHGAIAALETELRLDTGQAILIDNHRVMHGRRAFRGHRNLLGCYLPADDWQSLLRVARRERGEWEP